MRQLFEYFDPTSAGIILETVANQSGEKDLYMEGIFIQANVKNHNQRVYPVNEISHAVSALQEKIVKGESILGELDHPTELNINLDRVSHLITNIKMNGNNGVGKLKILPTPTGKIARALLESGVKLGVSSRGSGNVSDYGQVSDFEIVTVDIVAQPSAPQAYPKPIYESLFNMRGGKVLYDMAIASSHNDKSADKHLNKSILQFIKELKA